SQKEIDVDLSADTVGVPDQLSSRSYQLGGYLLGAAPSFPKPLLQKNLYPRNWIVNPYYIYEQLHIQHWQNIRFT
ncbi:TPA: hypothetical protein ACH5LV_001957, partial [Escherichia coli]